MSSLRKKPFKNRKYKVLLKHAPLWPVLMENACMMQYPISNTVLLTKKLAPFRGYQYQHLLEDKRTSVIKDELKTNIRLVFWTIKLNIRNLSPRLKLLVPYSKLMKSNPALDLTQLWRHGCGCLYNCNCVTWSKRKIWGDHFIRFTSTVIKPDVNTLIFMPSLYMDQHNYRHNCL